LRGTPTVLGSTAAAKAAAANSLLLDPAEENLHCDMYERLINESKDYSADMEKRCHDDMNDVRYVFHAS
jgi:hypothetical protein